MSIDSEVLRRNVGDGLFQDAFLLNGLRNLVDQSQSLLQNPSTEGQSLLVQPSFTLPNLKNAYDNPTYHAQSLLLPPDPDCAKDNSTINVQPHLLFPNPTL